MNIRSLIICLAVTLIAGHSLAASRTSRLKVDQAQSKQCFANSDTNKKYFLITSSDDTTVPGYGYGLVILLPGETGGEDLLDFAKQLYKDSLDKKYILAQLIAPRFTRKQSTIWPTQITTVTAQLFSTEDFIKEVIEDIRKTYKINNQRIFLMCCDNAGQAGYLASVRDDIPITGNLFVMCDFHPDWLGDIANVRGRAYYILHSVTDDVYSIEKPKLAYKLISENGGIANIQTYKGGHGWQGNSLKTIKLAMRWLRKNHKGVKTIESDERRMLEPQQADKALQIVPLSGIGEIRFKMFKNEIIKTFGPPQRVTKNKMLYLSQGLQLILSPENDMLIEIACGSTNKDEENMITSCKCKTSKEIKMASTKADIIAAYGNPTTEVPVQDNATIMFYDDIKSQFVLREDKLIYMTFKKP